MTAQFVKVGEQFINMAAVDVISDWDGRIVAGDALDPTLRVSFSEGGLHFKNQERADLLAWLNANAENANAHSTPVLVDLVEDDDRDALITRQRKELDRLYGVLRAVERESSPEGRYAFRTAGFDALADAINDVQAALIPF